MIEEHIKKHLKELLEQRAQILKTEEDFETADDIEKLIRREITSNFDRYEVDFILETLTKFGDAPNLVYDDNGMFQVSSDGIQQVVYDEERVEEPMTIIVDKDNWFPTIREALKHYLIK